MKNILFLGFLFALISCGGDDDGNAPLNTTNDAVVNIISISAITDNSAVVTAEVVSSSEAITERGIVWSSSGTPTIDDNKISSGSGLGEFQVTLQGLDAETNIQLRAYASSTSGIGYSGSNNFETLALCTGGFFSGDIILRTQTEVNDFGSFGYCEVTGTLSISEESNSTDPIIDLTPLNSITTVGASLRVVDTEELTNLSGLNVVSMGAQLSLIDNNSLTNIDALSNISGTISSLLISDCNNLSNIDALININRIGAEQATAGIFIGSNDNLENLDGLSNVHTLLGPLIIGENPLITNLDGLGNLDPSNSEIRQINIIENSQLENISALGSLSNGFEVEFVTIRDNTNLTSLQGFEGISGQEIQIENNSSLQNIDHLSGLTSARTLELNDNDLITNLDGLSNLISMSEGFGIFINSNDLLFDFCGLNNLIVNNGYMGTFNVNDNAYNPTIQDILDGNCSQ